MPFLSHPHASAPIASLTAFLRQMKTSSQAETAEQPGLLRYRTAVPHAWFNGVLVSRPPAGDEAAVIQQQLEYFRSTKVPAFTWWLEPEISVEEWAARLLPFGFTLNHQPPGMTCTLDDLPEAITAPAGFEIRPVSDLALLGVWADTFVEGYGLPPGFRQPYSDLMASLGLHGSTRHYLGFLDGVPSAAASIFYSDGIAGIYNVAVPARARGRGLGSAITLAPLQDARQQGYTLGALQSSEMGYGVYERLGFRKVCDVRHFSIDR